MAGEACRKEKPEERRDLSRKVRGRDLCPILILDLGEDRSHRA